MPPPRCKHFDDDGKPIRGGCNHPCCGFVHPDDPRWKYAERKQMASTRGGSFRARGLASSHSSSWGRPPPRLPEKSSEQEWDTSSWSAKTTTTPLPSSSTSTWITTHSDDAWSLKPGEPSTSSQRDNTTSNTFGRGTSSSTSSAWERKDESQNVDKNDGRGRVQNKDGGWSGWDSWGDSSTHDAGWGKNWAPPLADNGQEKSETENIGWNIDNRKQNTKNEIKIDEERSPLQAVMHTDTLAPSPKGKKSAAETGPSTHATSDDQMVVDGHQPRINPTAVVKKEDQRPSSMIHHRRDESDADPSASAVTPSLDSAQLSNASSTRSGPPSRSDIFATTIKYIQQAVRLKIELDEVLAMDKRWKNAQKSSSYARAPPRARQVLDEKRSKFKAEINELTRRFNASVSDLASLPDLTDPANASPKIDIREIMAYTAQMKEWMEELRIYHRSLVAGKQARIQATATEPATEMDKTGIFSVKEIQERVAELERRAEQLSEYFFLDKYTRVLDVEVAPLFEAVMTSGDWNNNHVKKRKQEVNDKAEALGKSLENEAMTAADLYRKVHAHDGDVEALLAEKQQLDEERARALAMLQQFEQWQKEDEEEIRSLTEQIQQLYLIRRPSPPPFNPHEPEILTELRSLVVKIVEREITPIVQAYREGFTQHHQSFVDQLYQKLQPALDLMQEMSCQAEIEVAAGRPAAIRPQQLSQR